MGSHETSPPASRTSPTHWTVAQRESPNHWKQGNGIRIRLGIRILAERSVPEGRPRRFRVVMGGARGLQDHAEDFCEFDQSGRGKPAHHSHITGPGSSTLKPMNLPCPTGSSGCLWNDCSGLGPLFLTWLTTCIMLGP